LVKPLANIRRGGGRGSRREEGQALVELALAMGFLLLLLTALLQFGSLYNTYEALTDAARTGARQLAIEYNAPNQNPCDPAVAQTVNSMAGVGSLQYSQVTPSFATATGAATTKSYCGSSGGTGCTSSYVYATTCNSAGAEVAGDEATITIKYPYSLNIFGMKIMNINLSAQASDAVE
jgi:Flp pilus assembly protein TadG